MDPDPNIRIVLDPTGSDTQHWVKGTDFLANQAELIAG
jgi:hypothetical protein